MDEWDCLIFVYNAKDKSYNYNFVLEPKEFDLFSHWKTYIDFSQ